MKRAALTLIILILLTPGITALEIQGPVFRGGLLFLGSSEPDAAPSPLLSVPGISLPLRFTDHILLEPALQFFGTWYGFLSDISRPVPFNIEDEGKAWVLGVLIDPAFRAEWPLGGTMAAGLSISPGFLLRFPLITEAGESFDTAAALHYFFSAGRFFFPKAGLYLSLQATENITLRFQADTWFPLYHAWDDGGGPFWDELIVCGWLGLSWRLPAK